jgi:hypothetical protein
MPADRSVYEIERRREQLMEDNERATYDFRFDV